jgi:hypothetical protein
MSYLCHVNAVVGVCIHRDTFWRLLEKPLKALNPKLYDLTIGEDSLELARTLFLGRGYKAFFQQLWPGKEIRICMSMYPEDMNLYIGRQYMEFYNQTDNSMDPAKVIEIWNDVKDTLAVFQEPVELNLIVSPM